MAAHGHPVTSNAWARARLTRGSSTGEIWEISSEYPEARLTVGTDPSAGWPIEAPGVWPVHCELFWDGQTLWVADTAQAGGVFLDGQRVGDWVQIEGPAELRFGQAALDVETSAPVAHQMASNPQHARPVTVTDLEAPPEDARPNAVFGGAAGDGGIPADLDSEATRVAASPVKPLEADRTRVAAPAGGGGAPSLGADLRPRLGGSSSPASSEPHAAEATRMVSMPGQPSAPATPGYPGYGSPSPVHGSPAPVVAPPPAHPGAPMQGGPVQGGPMQGGPMQGGPMQPPPAGPSLAGPPAPPAGSAPPPPPPPQIPAPPPGYPQAPAQAHPPTPPQGMMPGAPAEPGSPFVAPPSTTESAEKKESFLQKVVAVLKPEDSQAKTEGKQSLPTRTWILLGVTVAVTVGWLLWDDTPEPQPQPQQGQEQAAVAGQEGAEGEGETAGDEGEGETTGDEGETPGSEETADTEPAETQETEASPSSAAAAGSEEEEDEEDDEEGPSLQRRAADAYIAGRYADALEMYRELAAENPDDTSYASMVTILERRIREQCRDGTGPGGEPCET